MTKNHSLEYIVCASTVAENCVRIYFAWFFLWLGRDQFQSLKVDSEKKATLSMGTTHPIRALCLHYDIWIHFDAVRIDGHYIQLAATWLSGRHWKANANSNAYLCFSVISPLSIVNNSFCSADSAEFSTFQLAFQARRLEMIYGSICVAWFGPKFLCGIIRDNAFTKAIPWLYLHSPNLDSNLLAKYLRQNRTHKYMYLNSAGSFVAGLRSTPCSSFSPQKCVLTMMRSLHF